jgi:hypothetical protein
MAKKGKRKKKDDHNSDQNRDPEALAGNRALIIETWKARDELYKSLFGNYKYVTPAGYGPPAPLEADAAKAPGNLWSNTADPGDPNAESQHLAVLAYEPDPLRPYWTYITAGLCTPWLQDRQEEVSGFGMELMIKAPSDSPWPAQILRSMAYYIFNHAGPISPGVRIGLNESITPGGQSKLRNLLIWYADEAPDCWYQLPSGGFGIFTAIGITDDELKFGETIEEYGTWCIQQLLRQAGSGQVTDPNRASVMEHPDIEQMMSGVRTFADQFREHSGTFDPLA